MQFRTFKDSTQGAGKKTEEKEKLKLSNNRNSRYDDSPKKFGHQELAGQT